jgi:hypothetical protein
LAADGPAARGREERVALPDPREPSPMMRDDHPFERPTRRCVDAAEHHWRSVPIFRDPEIGRGVTSF